MNLKPSVKRQHNTVPTQIIFSCGMPLIRSRMARTAFHRKKSENYTPKKEKPSETILTGKIKIRPAGQHRTDSTNLLKENLVIMHQVYYNTFS